MKQLNGELVVRYQVLATMECTQAQADYILGANQADAQSRLGELIRSSLPVNERVYDHTVLDFRTDYGKCLVEHRERELKQIANSPTEVVV